ncbi:hypothetical protein K449DRAFT_433211 [Hypoxylon sp. EC38]|nr:hypothetical protein K449DRAFT_433211 [Hypoxylon sp. EC38]
MSIKRNSATWFEAMGGLSDYLDGDTTNNDAPPSVTEANSLAVDGDADHSNPEASVRTDSESPEHRQRSLDRAAADVTTATGTSPAVSPALLRKYSKQADELQARVLRRALAYESVTDTAYNLDGLASHEKDLDQQSQHPLLLRPGSTPPVLFSAAGEGRDATPSSRRNSPNDWKPQKPAYVRPNSDWDTKSDSGYDNVPYVRPLSRYEAYRPPRPPVQPTPQPLFQQQQQIIQSESLRRKSKPSPLNLYEAPIRDVSKQNSILGGYRDVTYSHAPRSADPIPRSGVQSSHTIEQYHPDYFNGRHSAQPAFEPYRPLIIPAEPAEAPGSPVSTEMGRGRQLPASSPSSPSTRPPFPPATPSPRSDRSASPSRGAWIADRPTQPRPSFIERAKRRMNRSLQSNLQRAGVRPKSSFEVRRVQKSPVADMFVPEEWPNGEDGALAELESMSIETDSRGSQSWSVDSSGLEERMRRHRMRKQLQQQLQQRQQEQQEEKHLPELPHEMDGSRDTSVRQWSFDRSRTDSLFLEGGDSSLDNPGSNTFFASEWSQQQVIIQAQEMVASLPASSPFHQGPFGANQPVAANNGAQQIATPPDSDSTSLSQSAAEPGPYLIAPPDDRKGLPSQFRDDLIQALYLASNEALTESPEAIEPPERLHRELTRKRGTRHLR